MSARAKNTPKSTADKGLPRYKPGQARRRKPKPVEVELPQMGVSLLLAVPSLDEQVEYEKRLQELVKEGDEVDAKAVAVRAISRVLVEPKMTPEDLAEEIGVWPMADVNIATTAALAVAGIRKEDLDAVQAEFRAQNGQ